MTDAPPKTRRDVAIGLAFAGISSVSFAIAWFSGHGSMDVISRTSGWLAGGVAALVLLAAGGNAAASSPVGRIFVGASVAFIVGVTAVVTGRTYGEDRISVVAQTVGWYGIAVSVAVAMVGGLLTLPRGRELLAPVLSSRRRRVAMIALIWAAPAMLIAAVRVFLAFRA